MRVLRIFHSAVVSGFRDRDRELQRRGVDVVLVSPRAWVEGGSSVVYNGRDDFVRVVPTWGRHPYRFVFAPWRLARAFRSGAFDIVDVHEEPASLAMGEALLVRRLLQPRAKVVGYSAQNLFKSYPPPFRWIERWALNTLSTIYFCNQDAVDVLRRKGYRGAAVVLGLGVDTSAWSPTDGWSPESPFRIGYVGRLDPHKGVEHLVAAMSDLPDATLTIVGDGSLREALERDVVERDLETRVRFRGFVGHDDLPAVYRTLDAVVVPSLASETWVEQFGRVVIEAMAMGVPVVASDTGALPEVVGDAGIVIPSGSPADIASAITQLRSDPVATAAMRERGLARARQYSWSTIAAAHQHLYESVLS
jgi:glycosyltransferase involved in cell wall biosynthesis